MDAPARLFVTVKAAVWEGDRLLLLREDPGDGQPVHDLPGGRLDLGESIADGLRRELREELGVELVRHSPLPVKVWSAVTPAGLGVVGLLFEVELAPGAFRYRAAEGILGHAFLTRAEYETTRAFVHKPFIADYYRERAAVEA